MQTLAGKSSDGKDYYFAYIERLKRIIVWVEGKQKYIIETNSELVCNCPGSLYHGHCRHVDFVINELDFNHTVKPSSTIRQIAEEYYVEWLTRNDNQ